jgi:hypothetical protein
MKNWIILIPEPMPLGLTFLLAKAFAMVAAFLVNTRSGGKVEEVLTVLTHRFLAAIDLLRAEAGGVGEPL